MTTDYQVDLRFISVEEALQYMHDLRGRDRRNHRRIQAWFDHCARIRSHLGGRLAIPAPPMVASEKRIGHRAAPPAIPTNSRIPNDF